MSDATNQPQEPPRAQSTTSEADADHGSGDAAPEERSIAGISDEQLPDDLQPGEDNPLAEPLDPDDPATRSQEELGVLDEGKSADESSDAPEDSGTDPGRDSEQPDEQE